MLCSTMRIVVPRPALIWATLAKTSLTTMGGEAERGLVEQEHLGGGHEAASEGQHLLLAARHLAGEVAALAAQDGEEVEHGVEAAGLLGGVLQVEAADLEVLRDAEVGEDAPPLRDEGDALLDDLVRGGGEPLAAPVDVAADDGGEAHDGLEDGGLAGPVGAHHADDLALADVEGDAVEGDDLAVVHGDAVELEQRQGARGGRVWVAGSGRGGSGGSGHRYHRAAAARGAAAG